MLFRSLVSLLEVENRSITSGRSDMSILWLDENGIQRKSYEPASDRQNFDCDPTTARYVISREEFEANSFKEIPLLGTLPKIPDGDSTVFQITSSAFLNSKNSISNRTNQKVNQINDTSIEVEVYRVLSDLASDPLQFNTSKPEQDPVSEDALLNRGIIDWKGVSFQRWLGAVANDDRKLLGKTPSTAGDFQQRAKLARKWITSSIERIPMDRTPQSPSQTAKELSGDRLDHAIMLVATLRALSVPARIAVGFQAEPSTVRPTVAFHAWAEYHDSERWIPIDSTISTETVPADRWKVTESTLPSPNSYDTFILATRFLIDTQVAVRSRR